MEVEPETKNGNNHLAIPKQDQEMTSSSSREASPSPAREEDIFTLHIRWKGGTYPCPVTVNEPLSQILDFIGEVLAFGTEYVQFICSGKKLPLDTIVGDISPRLNDKSKVLLVASNPEEVEYHRNKKG